MQLLQIIDKIEKRSTTHLPRHSEAVYVLVEEASTTVYARTARLSQFGKPTEKIRREHPVVNGNDTSRLPDEDLACRLKAADSDAFSLFFSRYASLVRSIAYNILRDQAEVDDVTQTVFWDMHRAINSYDAQKGSLRTWLQQYAYHRALNHKKSLEQRGFYRNSGLEAAEEYAGTRGLMFPAETAHAIRQALALLNDDQRMTLQLIFLEGKEMSDVAELLGQSLSNIRHHYYRGLRKLRDILGTDSLPGKTSQK